MSERTRQEPARRRRVVGVLGAAALSAGAVVPLSGSASADQHVQDIGPACQGQTDPVGFRDIQFIAPATQEAVNCLFNYGITEGRSATTYAPGDPVKRYEMALFISRSIDYIESSSDVDVVDLGAAPSSGFNDLGGVPVAARQAIDRLADLQIAFGKRADVYDPYGPVNRRDMARFINRLQTEVVASAYSGAAYAPTDTSRFADVPDTMDGSTDVYALEAAGVVQGHVGGLYQPFESVRRDHMALYIMRHLADNIENGHLGTKADVEAPEGFSGTVAVELLDKDADVFAGGGVEFAYDTNDTFTIGGASADYAAFEAALSTGDDVTVTTYRRDGDASSRFDLTDSNPATPTVTAAVSGDRGSENDVVVTVSPGDQDWDSVVLHRADGAADFAAAATLTSSDDADADTPGIQYRDEDLAAGEYRYRAANVNDGDQGEWSTVATVTAQEPADITPPTSISTVLETNSTNQFLLDAGDIIRVIFSEPLEPLQGSETIRVTDADGTRVDLINMVGNSSFRLFSDPQTIDGVEYEAGRVLRVTVGIDLPVIAPGEDAGIALPATIADQKGFMDAASNQWNISASTDVLIDEPL